MNPPTALLIYAALTAWGGILPRRVYFFLPRQQRAGPGLCSAVDLALVASARTLVASSMDWCERKAKCGACK